MLVQLSEVDFAYAGAGRDEGLIRGLTLQVNPSDRIGLVGPNGSGKSTLLRLMDGRLPPDRGTVSRARGLTIGYLQQSQELGGEGTVLDGLLRPFARILALHDELGALTARLEAAPSEALAAAYAELEERYRAAGGYLLEQKVRALAADLGFSPDDLGRGVSTLSGGERGRLELLRTLLAEPDLLLLDEPTNHLDLEATEHLEARLAAWPKAFVLVSHDRWFLRAVCRDIVELEGGRAVSYPGGWDRYVVERAARKERQQAAFARQKEEIARTEDFIRRNIAGQKTKQAKSRRKMLDKLERVERPEDDFERAGRIGLAFDVGDHPGGKEALKAEGLAVGFAGAPPLITGLDLTIYRGDRLGIVGPNGCGKSTLLRTLLGQLPPLAGQVSRGHEVRIGYFDQKLSDLDEEHSLIDEIRSVRGDFNHDAARAFLGRFQFSGDDAFKKVRGLSGGERNRLTLAKMMLRPRNLLALDEPTNHLDIPAAEVLEEALEAYAGTVVCVSHDRWFLDRVVTKILHVDEGRAELHLGNWSDWRGRQRTVVAPPAAKAEPAAATEDKAARLAERERRKAEERERERKRRRIAELEGQIAAAEAELKALDARLAADHGGDWLKLNGLMAEREALSARLEARIAEWEALATGLPTEPPDPPS
jgi:ATP-binding cassette subfamily F protein 3